MLLLAGTWPYFGVEEEPSAFGCPVIWEDNQAPVAMGLYHNEGNVEHVLHPIPDLGCKIFHFAQMHKNQKSQQEKEPALWEILTL
jgi:hypothetical protein